MVTIATFEEPTKAKHLKDRYAQSGVAADLQTDGQMQQVASGSKARGNVKVLIHEKDFDKAHNLLVDGKHPTLKSAPRSAARSANRRGSITRSSRVSFRSSRVSLVCCSC